MKEKIIAEELNRIKLLMGYRLSNTLTENYNSIGNKILVIERAGAEAIIKSETEVLLKAASQAELKSTFNTVLKDAKNAGRELKTTEGYLLKTEDDIYKALNRGALGPEASGMVLKDLITTTKTPAVKESSSKILAAQDWMKQGLERAGVKTR